MITEGTQDEARRVSAALEPSPVWQPMAKTDLSYPEPGVEIWENEIYSVTVRRQPSGWPMGAGGAWVQLGVHAHDGSARHDWREYQKIKNDICGPEWEAIELYPAESRLLDPSNYYMLWCAKRINIGKFGRRSVINTGECIAPQRGWI